MKIFIVTADDIEDHSPEAAFATREAAEKYTENMYQKEVERWKQFEGKGSAPDFRYSKKNFYSEVVEMELQQ
jgi:hypothetical protein